MTFARVLVAVLSLAAVSAAAGTSALNITGFTMPANLSSTCSTFLQTLDSDATLDVCIKSILGPTASFNSSSATYTSTEIKNAFDQLCAPQTACDQTVIRMQLTDFAANCVTDLGATQEVTDLYDILYTLLPIMQAMCVRDPNTGDLCVLSASSTGNNTLSVQEPGTQAALGPDLDALGTANAPFLFVTPDTDKNVLCSQCTLAMLSVYVGYEYQMQYWSGLNGSPLLQGQGALLSAVQSDCGANFTASLAINAGGAANVETSGASSRAASSTGVTLGATVLLALFSLL